MSKSRLVIFSEKILYGFGFGMGIGGAMSLFNQNKSTHEQYHHSSKMSPITKQNPNSPISKSQDKKLLFDDSNDFKTVSVLQD